jgi:two-component system, CitB family, sensor kinase
MAKGRQARRRSLARQILLLQLVVVAVLVLGGLVLVVLDARAEQDRRARQTVRAVAVSVAASPSIPSALRTAEPTRTLQPFAERIRRDTRVDFVVIMSPDGIRYTHPDPAQIGGHYIGSIEQARAGQVHVESYVGTLGPSVRAIAPVRDGDRIVALVSAGITTAALERSLWPNIPPLLLAAAAALAAGAVGAWLISRRLDRQTRGASEAELASMVEFYDGVLHAVGEGLVVVDHDQRLQLANDEAIRLLGLPRDATGRPLAELGLPSGFVERVSERDSLRDELFLVGDKVVVVNRREATWRGRRLGAVVTLRDHTDLRAVIGELDSARSLADSLRSQNHESANRLHTVVSLIEMGRPDDAVQFATRELELAQRLTDEVVAAVDDPVVAALLVGKTAQAAERGVLLKIADGSHMGQHHFDQHDLVTLLGNLIDNALDAAVDSADPPGQVELLVQAEGDYLRIRVGDSGPGLPAEDADHVFQRGWSTKPQKHGLTRGVGLALVGQTVRRLGGTIRVQTSPLGGAEFEILVGDPPASGESSATLVRPRAAQ